jgi:hypothetical protein
MSENAPIAIAIAFLDLVVVFYHGYHVRGQVDFSFVELYLLLHFDPLLPV